MNVQKISTPKDKRKKKAVQKLQKKEKKSIAGEKKKMTRGNKMK
jgi:hypothetical protein